MVAKRASAAGAGGHEEVLAAAREVDELLLVGGAADCEVELRVEAELAGVDAVLGAEGLALGQTVVGGEGQRSGLARVPADEHALMVGEDVTTCYWMVIISKVN